MDVFYVENFFKEFLQIAVEFEPISIRFKTAFQISIFYFRQLKTKTTTYFFNPLRSGKESISGHMFVLRIVQLLFQYFQLLLVGYVLVG